MEDRRPLTDAGAMVASMVMNQALWMSVAGRGDGRPPKELWDAVNAEDWSMVRREWDQWAWPEFREINRAARDWRALALTALQTTVKSLKDAGVSSPAPPFDASAPPGEDAIMREWLPWIHRGIAAVKDGARSDEWPRFAEALPVELRALAGEHPERRAEVAASAFETDMFHRGLLDKDGDA